MASPSITLAAAVDALRAAGRTVTRHTRADAAMRHGCQTLRYVVDGRAVNVGRLRQLALAAADAAPVPAPALATLRADAAAGRPVSLAAMARALSADLLTPAPTPRSLRARAAARLAEGHRLASVDPAAAGAAREHGETFIEWADEISPAPTGDAWAGQPWDPGTPDARARVALQGERVATLWPIAQALRGEGVTLPGAWASDGPVMAGEWSYDRALAALPLGAIAQAAAALAALPPVTAAQDRALTLCRSANCHTCPGLYHRPAAIWPQRGEALPTLTP
jgi:hypothetical protein